jgi:hypothetical protein
MILRPPSHRDLRREGQQGAIRARRSDADDNHRTTHLIMIENVDGCWDVVARADV